MAAKRPSDKHGRGACVDNKARAFVYAFLSRLFEKELGTKEIEELRKNRDLLATIGEASREYFAATDTATLQEALNIDYHSLFSVNSQPIKSIVVDATGEILVGLQNPVMYFYFENGYEIDMNRTEILAPDHLAIEFGFMQNLAFRDEKRTALRFLREHLLAWVPPYLCAIQEMAQTPFYRDVCDFTIEYLFRDFALLQEVGDDAV